MAIKILDVESIDDAMRAKTMLKIQAIRVLHDKIFEEEKRTNRLISFLTIFCAVIGLGLVAAIFLDHPIAYESAMNVTSNAEKFYEVEDTRENIIFYVLI
uniref:Uncharacterized protein n=1 Tax=Romanomermis culicivorax TaxID=13658 RepID=A0A915I334_ROMCU